MNRLSTSKCPKYPAHLTFAKPALPCPDLSDEEIDTALVHIRSKMGGEVQAARTQYGRRVQVDTYLKLERKEPVSFSQFMYAITNSIQPR